MPVRIQKGNESKALIGRVEAISGVDLGICLQCKKCTSGCPVAGFAQSLPSEVIRQLHLGIGDEVLRSDIIWVCASCETCSARCPMGIDLAAVMDALRALAIEKGAPLRKGNVPLFNRAFLATVRLFGRTYDLGMIGAYKLGTLSFMKDTEKFPAMLKKGKIALIPPRGSGSSMVRRIFDRIKRNRGTGS
ncbi:4Fe-4S dicluster domain-containing protein [bacterium]|nr:4Fe-4S dicluster domain-containing protein [bacterium]